MRIRSRRGTRDRILAAAEAVLGEYGYYGARLQHVASRVGVQKASLFHYFPSKLDLYCAVVEEGIGETEEVIRRALASEGQPIDKVRALVGAYVDVMAARPARARILLRQSLGDAPPASQPPEAERVLALVADFIAAGQRAGAFAPVDPVAFVLGVVGMVVFFVTAGPVVAPAWFGDRTRGTAIERVKRHVVEVVERGLVVDAAPRARRAQRAV